MTNTTETSGLMCHVVNVYISVNPNACNREPTVTRHGIRRIRHFKDT